MIGKGRCYCFATNSFKECSPHSAWPSILFLADSGNNYSDLTWNGSPQRFRCFQLNWPLEFTTASLQNRQSSRAHFLVVCNKAKCYNYLNLGSTHSSLDSLKPLLSLFGLMSSTFSPMGYHSWPWSWFQLGASFYLVCYKSAWLVCSDSAALQIALDCAKIRDVSLNK